MMCNFQAGFRVRTRLQHVGNDSASFTLQGRHCTTAEGEGTDAEAQGGTSLIATCRRPDALEAQVAQVVDGATEVVHINVAGDAWDLTCGYKQKKGRPTVTPLVLALAMHVHPPPHTLAPHSPHDEPLSLYCQNVQ